MSDLIVVTVGNRETVQSTKTGQTKCPGCGDWFRGVRGLRTHMSRPHITLACRPFPKPKDEPGEPLMDESTALIHEFVPRDIWADAQVCRNDDDTMFVVVRPANSSRTIRVLVRVQQAVEL